MCDNKAGVGSEKHQPFEVAIIIIIIIIYVAFSSILPAKINSYLFLKDRALSDGIQLVC